MGRESLPPRLVGRRRDSETDVMRPASVVRWNRSARQADRIKGTAAEKQDQHLSLANLESLESRLIACDGCKLQDFAVESAGSGEIVHI